MSESITVVGAVITCGDAVLACRRAPHKSAGGRWEFPGGKVEDGESPPQALARELAEELSIDARVGDLLIRETTAAAHVAIDLACYWVTTPEAPVAGDDHDALRWVPRAELAALDWAEPDLPAVRLLINSATSGATRVGTATGSSTETADRTPTGQDR